jgi:hypothetical protein
MESITLRAGTPVESVGPKRLAEVEELASLLTTDDRSVTIEVVDRIPSLQGFIWAETLAIFIGTAAGGGLTNAVVKDVYDTAKAWARDKFKKKTEATPSGQVRTQKITFYRPDGTPIASYEIGYKGEREHIDNEIEGSDGDEPQR